MSAKICQKLRYQLQLPESIPQDFLLLTLHRPENVDNPQNLKLLVNHIGSTNILSYSPSILEQRRIYNISTLVFLQT